MQFSGKIDMYTFLSWVVFFAIIHLKNAQFTIYRFLIGYLQKMLIDSIKFQLDILRQYVEKTFSEKSSL